MPARQINLLPQKELETTTVGKLLKFVLTYGRYIIVGTQLVVLIAFFSRFKLDREFTDLQDSIEQKQAIIQSLAKFETEVRTIQARLTTLSLLKQNHDFIRQSLLVVKKILPPGSALTRLTLKENTITLAGMSQDESSLAELLNRVYTAEELSSVQVDRIGKRSDSEVIDFSLTIVLKDFASTTKTRRL